MNRIGVSALLVFIAAASASFAASRTWTGNSAVGGNWSFAPNWENNIAPVAGDTLVFPAGAARLTCTNNFVANTMFPFIAFNGSGYNVYGNAITITNQFVLSPSGAALTFRPGLRLGNDTDIFCLSPTATMTLSGDINLNGHALFISADGDITMSGAISGTGNLRKLGAGDLIFSGSDANTYDGVTSVSEGTLRLRKALLLGFPDPIVVPRVSVPDIIFIGSGVAGVVSEVVVLERDHQIADTATVRINASGRLDLNGNNDTVNALVLLAGNVVTADGTNIGTLTVNSNISAINLNSLPEPATIFGRLNLGAASNQIFDVELNAELRVSANITGNAGLIKTNLGELWLAASNSYAGPTRVNRGMLRISHDHALGSTASGTVLGAGTLNLYSSVVITNEPLTSDNFFAAIQVEAGNSTWASPIVLDEFLTLFVESNLSLFISGGISGTANLSKEGPGVVRMIGPGTNTYTGATIVYEGELQLLKSAGESIHGPLIIGDNTGTAFSDRVRLFSNDEISSNSAVTIRSTGMLQVNGFSDVIGSLSGTGRVDLGTSGALSVGADNGTTSFWGEITGSGARVEKVGTGVLTMERNHTFTGETRVGRGSLLVNGSIAPSSLVIVSNLATLGGNGIVSDVNVLSGGILGPGVGPGILTATGSVTFASNSLYCIDINGLAVGSGYDQLLHSGPIHLGGARLEISLATEPGIDDSFTIIQNPTANPVQGTFAGLPQGSLLVLDGMTFFVDYEGGDGNDVVLTRIEALRFSSITMSAPNQITWQAQGTPGRQYVIEATPHLNSPIPWTPISTNTANGAGMLQFIDNDRALYPMRFYRIAVP